MRPPHDPAPHARLSTRAAATVIRSLTVDRMANAWEPFPHGNTLPAIFPRYFAPAGASVAVNATPLRRPETPPSHGPAAHFGVACHVSSHVGGPVRPAAP